MKKRLLMLCLCMILAILGSVPAYAEEGDGEIPVPYTNLDGNGYTVREVTYEGYTYDARLSLSFSATYGARAVVYCEAAIPVAIGNLTVKFITKSYGYATESGGGTRVHLSANNHTEYSDYVTYSKGMPQVKGYDFISGSATFEGENDCYVSATMKP